MLLFLRSFPFVTCEFCQESSNQTAFCEGTMSTSSHKGSEKGAETKKRSRKSVPKKDSTVLPINVNAGSNPAVVGDTSNSFPFILPTSDFYHSPPASTPLKRKIDDFYTRQPSSNPEVEKLRLVLCEKDVRIFLHDAFTHQHIHEIHLHQHRGRSRG